MRTKERLEVDGEAVRCARRRISRLRFAHGRESVSAQCLQSIKLEDFFNILLRFPNAQAGHEFMRQWPGVFDPHGRNRFLRSILF